MDEEAKKVAWLERFALNSKTRTTEEKKKGEEGGVAVAAELGGLGITTGDVGP